MAARRLAVAVSLHTDLAHSLRHIRVAGDVRVSGRVPRVYLSCRTSRIVRVRRVGRPRGVGIDRLSVDMLGLDNSDLIAEAVVRAVLILAALSDAADDAGHDAGYESDVTDDDEDDDPQGKA